MENSDISKDLGDRQSLSLECSNASCIVKMTSIDSGMETGNESNDSAVNQSSSNHEKISTFETEENNSSSTQLRPFQAIDICPNKRGLRRLFDSRRFDKSLFFNRQNPQRAVSEFQITGLKLNKMLAASVNKDLKMKKTKIIKKSLKEMLRKMDEQRLRQAATVNDVERVKCLLLGGVSPNSSDEQGRTPLHIASGRGYEGIVGELLKFGADTQSRDCIGNTPLHLAVVTNKIFVVTSLLEAGADPLSVDHNGYNPLQLAQTKLRMLQDSKSDNMLRVKTEFHSVVNMLLAYLKNRRDCDQQIESLSNVCSRLTLANTNDQLQDEVRNLLSDISTLSLTS